MDKYNYLFGILQKKLLVDFNKLLRYDKDNREFRTQNYATLRKAINISIQNQISADRKTGEENTIPPTISIAILKQVIKYGYNIPIPISKKNEDTLSKIAIFLGYKNWSDFMDKHDNDWQDKLLEVTFQNALLAMRYLFFEFKEELIQSYFVKESSICKLLIKTVKTYKAKGLVPLKMGTSRNYGYFTKTNTLERDEKSALMHVKENWLGYSEHEIKHQKLGEPTWIDCIYQLRKDGEEWRVVDRFVAQGSNKLIL